MDGCRRVMSTPQEVTNPPPCPQLPPPQNAQDAPEQPVRARPHQEPESHNPLAGEEIVRPQQERKLEPAPKTLIQHLLGLCQKSQ